MKVNNLIGKRFGKLTVFARAENSPSGKAKWFCICECGNLKRKSVLSNDLISGRVKSCGCLYKESNKGRNTTHGLTHSRIYNIWIAMRDRCKTDAAYIRHKITVCDEWENSFENFYKWAMANGYSDELTLDRINTYGNYEPDNCRWATMKVQQNNRTNNRIVEYEGKPLTLAELADILGIPYATLQWRIDNGWDTANYGITPDYKNKIKRSK